MWKKNGSARQATDENIIRRMRSACWKSTYTHTHTQNTFCFSTTTMVTRTRLITFIVPCLPRFILFRGLGFLFRLHKQIFNPKCLVAFVIFYECTLKYMTNAPTSILSQIVLLRPSTKPVNFNKLCPVIRVPSTASLSNRRPASAGTTAV
jgi:hypothetical protein